LGDELYQIHFTNPSLAIESPCALTRKLRILPSPAALAPRSQAWERLALLGLAEGLARQERGVGGKGKVRRLYKPDLVLCVFSDEGEREKGERNTFAMCILSPFSHFTSVDIYKKSPPGRTEKR
jgi:hypothetical protein